VSFAELSVVGRWLYWLTCCATETRMGWSPSMLIDACLWMSNSLVSKTMYLCERLHISYHMQLCCRRLLGVTILTWILWSTQYSKLLLQMLENISSKLSALVESVKCMREHLVPRVCVTGEKKWLWQKITTASRLLSLPSTDFLWLHALSILGNPLSLPGATPKM